MATDAASNVAIAERPPDPNMTGARRRFLRAVIGNRKATAGAVILLIVAFVAAFPGLIAPDSPQASSYPANLGPSAQHLLGTTQIGQDVFSQLIWSTRLTLLVTLVVSAI